MKLVVGTADDDYCLSACVRMCNVRAGYHPRLVISLPCPTMRFSLSSYLHSSLSLPPLIQQSMWRALVLKFALSAFLVLQILSKKADTNAHSNHVGNNVF